MRDSYSSPTTGEVSLYMLFYFLILMSLLARVAAAAPLNVILLFLLFV